MNTVPIKPVQVEQVKCECGHVLYDGEAIKSRCVKPGKDLSYALCKCKRWVNVPICLKPL